MSGYHPPASQTGPCEEGMSRCHNCGECKADPGDFYDGLFCIVCVEADEAVNDDYSDSILWLNQEELGA